MAWHTADDPQADKLLLVMEYAEAGPIMRGDHSINKIPLAEGVALKFFRDVLQVRLVLLSARCVLGAIATACVPIICGCRSSLHCCQWQDRKADYAVAWLHIMYKVVDVVSVQHGITWGPWCHIHTGCV